MKITDKREAILKAAFDLFGQKGPEHTTTDEIAQQAGISTGTLYKYYPHKKAVFLGMYEWYFFAIAAPSLARLNDLKQPFALRALLEDIADRASGASLRFQAYARQDDGVGFVR